MIILVCIIEKERGPWRKCYLTKTTVTFLTFALWCWNRLTHTHTFVHHTWLIAYNLRARACATVKHHVFPKQTPRNGFDEAVVTRDFWFCVWCLILHTCDYRFCFVSGLGWWLIIRWRWSMMACRSFMWSSTDLKKVKISPSPSFKIFIYFENSRFDDLFCLLWAGFGLISAVCVWLFGNLFSWNVNLSIWSLWLRVLGLVWGS